MTMLLSKAPIIHLPAPAETAPHLCRDQEQEDGRWPAGPMDELTALLEAERSYRRMPRSDRCPCLGHGNEASTERAWRHRICEWYYQVVDQYGFDREIVGVALSYFDRYVRRTSSSNGGAPVPRDVFQLSAATSLYLAIKIHCTGEDRVARRRAQALAGLKNGHLFSRKDLERMELHMLEVLEWRLNPPTMHQFALRYAALHPVGGVCARSAAYLHDATCYQAELAAFLPHLLERYEPSILAYAATLNATDALDRDVLPPEMREEWLSLAAHPSVKMDAARIREAREALREMCPRPPASDAFERPLGEDDDDAPRDSAPSGRGRRVGAASPAAVADV